MSDRLVHRGPDGSAMFVRAGIGLVHTRLSIIDPSPTGAQPWVDERWALVFNGEIYNHRELRRDLETRGVQFKGTSDTEALFHMLRVFGVRTSLERLRGMFAFAFTDLASGATFLCRDRLGIKPLFYLERDGRTIFASEVKAIAAATAVEIDPLVTFFATAGAADHSGRFSPFRDVLQVPPGHYLEVTRGRSKSATAYHRVLDDVDEGLYRELDLMSREEAADLLDQTLQRSVASMLMSDVPMGAFVSGGVDSGLLATLAGRITTTGLSLFTSDVRGEFSEVEGARELARWVHRPLHEVPFEPTDLLEQWAACTFHYEAPIITHSNAIPFSTVAMQANRCGVKPVLTGEGADELFLGYPALLTDRYRPLVTAPMRAVEWPYRKSSRLSGYLFRQIDLETKDTLRNAVTRFEHDQRAREFDEVFGWLPPSKRREQVHTLDMLQEHLISLLQRNDRMGMMAGIESRFPFLGEEVVRIGINLPANKKIEWGARVHDVKHPFLLEKAIVRRVADRHLSSRMTRRKKIGFPMHGLRDVQVRSGAFSGGYLESALGLDDRAQDCMLSTQPPYQVAKLLSVEVFGRLFGLGHGVKEVQSWVKGAARIDAAPSNSA